MTNQSIFSRSLAVSLVSLLVAACGPGDQGASSSSAASGSPSGKSTGSAKPSASASSAAAEPPFTPDADTVKAIQAVAQNCKIEDDSFPRDCKNNEAQALLNLANEKKPDGYFGTAAFVATGDGAKDKQLFRAAVYAFNFAPDDTGIIKKMSTPAAAGQVIKLIPLVPNEAHGVFAARAGGVLLFAGKRAELTKLLTSGNLKDDIRADIYANYFNYGGADASTDLMDATKDKSSQVRYNAGAATGYAIYSMFGSKNVAEADKAKMCDFAKGLLASGDDEVFYGALDSMSRCKGAYIDAGVDALDKKSEKPSERLANTCYHMCWSEGVVHGSVNGTKEQCEKSLGVLEKITKVKDVPANVLAQTMWAIGQLGQSAGAEVDKKGKAIRTKFAGDKNKQVAENAKKDYSK